MGFEAIAFVHLSHSLQPQYGVDKRNSMDVKVSYTDIVYIEGAMFLGDSMRHQPCTNADDVHRCSATVSKL